MALLDDDDSPGQRPMCLVETRTRQWAQFELEDNFALRPFFVAKILRRAALCTEEQLSVSDYKIISIHRLII